VKLVQVIIVNYQ